MIEQKIKTFVYYHNQNRSIDVNKEITEDLSKGWYIKFQPTVIPAFGGYAPEIIFILEREVEEKSEKEEAVKKEKPTIYSWWQIFDHDANGLNGCRCVECGYENWYYKKKEPNECPHCHAKMDNQYI